MTHMTRLLKTLDGNELVKCELHAEIKATGVLRNIFPRNLFQMFYICCYDQISYEENNLWFVEIFQRLNAG